MFSEEQIKSFKLPKKWCTVNFHGIHIDLPSYRINYIAMDSDGYIWGYGNEPTLARDNAPWWSFENGEFCLCLGYIYLGFANHFHEWRRTLIKVKDNKVINDE